MGWPVDYKFVCRVYFCFHIFLSQFFSTLTFCRRRFCGKTITNLSQDVQLHTHHHYHHPPPCHHHHHQNVDKNSPSPSPLLPCVSSSSSTQPRWEHLNVAWLQLDNICDECCMIITWQHLWCSRTNLWGDVPLELSGLYLFVSSPCPVLRVVSQRTNLHVEKYEMRQMRLLFAGCCNKRKF